MGVENFCTKLHGKFSAQSTTKTERLGITMLIGLSGKRQLKRYVKQILPKGTHLRQIWSNKSFGVCGSDVVLTLHRKNDIFKSSVQNILDYTKLNQVNGLNCIDCGHCCIE